MHDHQPLGAIAEHCGTLLDSLDRSVPVRKPVDIGDQFEHLLSGTSSRAVAVPWISFMRLPLPIAWLTAMIPETPRRDIRGTTRGRPNWATRGVC